MPAWWDEFRQRKFARWTLGYLAAGWVTYEVLSLIGENFAWPPVVMRIITVLIGAGLLLTTILAWYHGERGRQRVGAVELVLLAGAVLGTAVAVRAVWISNPAAPTVQTAPNAAEAAYLRNSVAVLPLLSRSNDPDGDFFSDGLTEELLRALSRVPGLRVAARTSSFAFRDRSVAADSNAKALGVRHLLDGSAHRRGDTLRISVGLVDAIDGYELWSERYVRPTTDVFRVQEEIARAVIDAMPLEPVLLNTRWELPRDSTSLEAYELYLLGRQAWRRRTGEDLLRAVDLFERAIALDSLYAPAWAGLAETWVVLPGYASISERTAYERLRLAALRALALDSLMVEAYTALGYGSAWQTYDFRTGIDLIRRALEIDPDYAPALHWQGELLAHAGRFEASQEHLERAMSADPLSGVTRADYGQALQLAGELEASVSVLEAHLAGDPGYLIAEYWLLYPCLLTERWDRAAQLASSIGAQIGLEPDGLALAVRALAGRASREEALAALDAQPRAVPGISRTLLAALYGQLGALDPGFEILEKGAESPFQGVVYLITHPVFAPYRDDPRYPPLAELVDLGGGRAPADGTATAALPVTDGARR
jgi:TolB-like protein